MIETYTIQNELQADEKLLWQGKPLRGIRFRLSSLPHMLFAIVFNLIVGFALYVELTTKNTAYSHNNSGGMGIFITLLFQFVGICLLIGPPIFDSIIRASAEYAVTSKRVITVKYYFGQRKVQSVALKLIPDISYVENKDGTGTITFKTSTSPFTLWVNYNKGQGSNLSALIPQFYLIPDVRNVYNIIQRAHNESD